MTDPSSAPRTLYHYTELPRTVLRRNIARGYLLRVAPGWYAMAIRPHWEPWGEAKRLARDRLQALRGVIRGDLAITGPYAALLLGAEVDHLPPVIDVIGQSNPSTSSPPVFLRRIVRRLEDSEVQDVDGFRVTAPARTAIETARLHGCTEGLVVADSLIGLGFDLRDDRFDRTVGDRHRAEFRATTAEIFQREPRLRGNGPARAVARWADGRAETPIETKLRRACLVIGLPEPELQVEVLTREGRYYPDLTFTIRIGDRTVTIHVEADGDRKYKDRVDRDKEHTRDAAIRALGHQIVRLSGHQITADAVGAVRRHVLPVLPPEALATLTPIRELDPAWWARQSTGSADLARALASGDRQTTPAESRSMTARGRMQR